MKESESEETHMANRPPYSDADEGTGVGRDRESTTGTPRWVMVVGIIVIVVVLLFVVMIVTGGVGEHSLGCHALSGGVGTPLASVREGYTPPTGLHTQPGS
jgi:hypothetical protein